MMKVRHYFLWFFLICLGLGAAGAIFIYVQFIDEIPNVEVLKTVQFQVPLRIYSSDHKLIAEYGEKRRIPVDYQEIPDTLIHAILSTEDQRFFEHPGVDVIGLLRAAKHVLIRGTRSQGGSTITMQVARNFFLSRKKTYRRKINEILLAIIIDQKLSKQKILELYLNKIYMGHRAYGVAAAAEVYYGKSLKELSLAQMAMLAGLPKAPSGLNPLSNPEGAIKRRNHVLARMLDVEYIDQATYEKTIKEPLTARYHHHPIQLDAPYVAESVRKMLVEQFENDVYTQGYEVITTVDSHLQELANKTVMQSILAYDKRHEYRGPVFNWGAPDPDLYPKWQKELADIPTIAGLRAGVITHLEKDAAKVLLADGSIISLDSQGLLWVKNQEILDPGDVIYLEKASYGWRLSQLPMIEGALVALKPTDGGILSLVGGFDYQKSKFNRATQAERQAGSIIKPFLYSAALAKGYTLASIINDAPIVINDPGKSNLWRPQNASRRFYGPTRLRIGLTKSRNLISIRLLQDIGIDYAVNYLRKFGFAESQLPRSLSLALGSNTVTPLQMATAYCTFANGGYKVSPHIVDKIVDSRGKEIYSYDTVKSEPPTIVTAQNSFLITSVLRDVIRHGTARAARILNRSDLAGKTGTTNDQMDVWFSGFNADIVVTTWMGFDIPSSVREYSSQTALPMWIKFMQGALNGKKETTLIQPPGLVAMRINPDTGKPAEPWSKNAVFELFRAEHAPHKEHHFEHGSYGNEQHDQSIQELF